VKRYLLEISAAVYLVLSTNMLDSSAIFLGGHKVTGDHFVVSVTKFLGQSAQIFFQMTQLQNVTTCRILDENR